MNFNVPVYVFTGFLESGKTSFIKETLSDPGFTDKEKTLIICCEEGIEEYDKEFCDEWNVVVHYVDNMEDVTYDLYKDLDKKYGPDRIMIELNGTWNPSTFLDILMPLGWVLVQIISCVDASTFQIYAQNMKQMIFNNLSISELIIFNRCSKDTNKRFIRTNVKAINRGAQIVYVGMDGEVIELTEDDLPFDVKADPIVISDDDYGLWYMDASDHPEKYDGKRIQFKGIADNAVTGPDGDAIVVGRNAMVCCAEDLRLIGLLVYDVDRSNLNQKDWVIVTGRIEVRFDVRYNQNIVAVHAEKIEKCEPLEDEYVYFN